MAQTVSVEGNAAFDRLTSHARKTISVGFDLAKRHTAKQYESMHLFLAIISRLNSVTSEVFNRTGVDVAKTRSSVLNQLRIESSGVDTATYTQPKFSKEIKDVINTAFSAASDLGQVHVGDEHLLLAMFRKEVPFLAELQKLGLEYTQVRKIIASITPNKIPGPSGEDTGGMPELPFPDLPPFPGNDFLDDFEEGNFDLPNFARDLNELAANGKFPTITGRDEEIDRLVHVLSRKTKNNPILVGEAGVGKTAIVEGFVSKLVDGELPSSFMDKRIVSLDVASILSGARLRGDVEERINNFVQYVVEAGNVIVFIDEIHQIVGAGSSGSKDAMDVGNILKPHLTNPDFSIIGATTNEEYSKYFGGETALSRRFQSIRVDELDVESAITVITKLKPDFEQYHKVKINDDAIETAVKLSKKFIQDRFLPDKAIDILDEASASIKIGREIAIEPELSKLGEKLIETQNKKEKALANEQMGTAAKLKKEEEKIIDEIEAVIEGEKKVSKRYQKTVTEELVKKTIVSMTKIPIAASDITDKRLKSLPKDLRSRIVGQDHVIENVSLAVQRSHIGLTDQTRPLASFLFLGPTGVGKTRLAKTIAKELFGSEDLIFQLDMSEFMEQHSVAKLIGSPPGYVGFQQGGQLTEFVRQKPYAVILFDEIEKAHPDTLNLLLQVLEEGQLVDGQGRSVSFRNTIVIMTSNIGAEEVSNSNTLGFDIPVEKETDEKMSVAFEEMREKIMEELRHTLRPELLNRIDLIDVFRGLNKDDSLQITKIELDDLKVRLLEKKILLEVDSKVEDHINEEGYSKEYGGRNIRRKVQEVLENGLAEYIIQNDVRKKKHELLKVSVKMKKGVAVFSHKKG